MMLNRIIFVNSITTTLYNYGFSSVPEQSKHLDTSIPPRLERTTTYQSFDELIKEVDELKEANKKLAKSLTRKYNHCYRLQNKVRVLERNIAHLVEDDEIFTSQSGEAEPGRTIAEGSAMTTEGITAFADEDAGWTDTIGSAYDETMDLAHNPDGELGDFLTRPIRARVDEWAVGQPLFYQDDVWSTFLSNPFVADKIANYELIRMKLHARLIISGTKFHYGRAIAGYNPLAGSFDEITVARNFLDVDIVQLSQKPHVFLNPTKNTGGSIDMPFFFNKNYISLNEPQDPVNMGNLTVKSFGNLLHANGGNDPVTVTLYLWASDVVLTMPTSQNNASVLRSQAGKQKKKKSNKNTINSQDEYGTGIISKPAAMIAKAAGLLEDLPLLRPYALATQMVASKVGDVAKIFGYSRPSVITDIQLFKPNPTGNLANADASDAVHKLTLDSKAELTVDSRTVGLDGTDQMGIKDIAMRESYLTTFSFTPTNDVDDLLWNTVVQPSNWALGPDNGGGVEIHPTPAAMIANSFDTWQGTMKYRFQIVKSDFHKGKVLVRYDPNALDADVNYNTNYSRVIDLAEEDDFEIEVGWGQSRPWLQCAAMRDGGVDYSDSIRQSKPDGFGNGVLELNVLNKLVSPSVDSSITINVYVSCGEDIRFAAPSNKFYQALHVFPNASPLLASQSGMEADVAQTVTDKPVGADPIQMIASEGDCADNTPLVFYGDPPTSLRELMKRYTFEKQQFPVIPNEGVLRVQTLLNKNLPYFSGWDPEGIDRSDVDETTPLNAVQTGPIGWFAPCYAAYRGALRKKYFLGGSIAGTNPGVVRRDFQNGGNGEYSYASSDLTTVDVATLGRRLSTSSYQRSMQGASVTNAGVNNTIEVELPYYQDQRLSSSRIVGAQSLQSNSHTLTTTSFAPAEGILGAALGSAYTSSQSWGAVGEDFTFFFWTGAPILYNYTVDGNS